MAAHKKRNRQRGAALLLVLWTALLLSVVLAGALAASRIEAKIAAVKRQQFEADLALRAALDFAAWRIAAGDYEGEGPIVADFRLNGYSVMVERSIEEEKLDINRSDEALFENFFRHIGIETDDAVRLAAEIADWRDEDELARPNGAEIGDYASARDRRIENRPFNSLSELKAVLHMTPELYECAAPALTLFGSGSAPSARAMALIGLPPLSEEAPRGTPRLGTSMRGATAGGVHVVEATAMKEGSVLAPQKLSRVFRVSGRLNEPFEQVAEFRPKRRPPRSCALINRDSASGPPS